MDGTDLEVHCGCSSVPSDDKTCISKSNEDDDDDDEQSDCCSSCSCFSAIYCFVVPCECVLIPAAFANLTLYKALYNVKLVNA